LERKFTFLGDKIFVFGIYLKPIFLGTTNFGDPKNFVGALLSRRLLDQELESKQVDTF